MLDGFGEKEVKECWVRVTDKEVEHFRNGSPLKEALRTAFCAS